MEEQLTAGYADQVSRNRPGATLETAADGTLKPAGLYRHPVSGAELITQNDPLWGDGQGRAAERVGFVYVGPAPEGSIKTLVSASQSHASQPERELEASADELKGLRARLNQLEAAEAKRTDATVLGAVATIQVATDQTEARTGLSVGPDQDLTQPAPRAKAVRKTAKKKESK